MIDGWARPDFSVRAIEPAGKWYGALAAKYAKLTERMQKGASAHFESSNESEDDEEVKIDPDDIKKGGQWVDEEEDEGEKMDKNEDFERKRKKKTKEQIEKEALEGNLYGALEIFEKTEEADEKMITKAYRKMALKYHPDKLGKNLTERDKEVWLKIQEAYETLIDPAKRRKYDSSLPFDESIPEQDDFEDYNFYEVFTRYFNLNSRWSVKQPTPNFGNEHMPLPNVKKFYKFWFEFNSWREFSQYDEYDVTEAEDRYERRYMEQENKRCRAKYVKLERQRILKLVELAYDNDPRIRKEREEIEAEKQRKKDEIRARKQAAAKVKEDAIRKRQEEREAEERAK